MALHRNVLLGESTDFSIGKVYATAIPNIAFTITNAIYKIIYHVGHKKAKIGYDQHCFVIEKQSEM